jgi:hypothetical protein
MDQSQYVKSFFYAALITIIAINISSAAEFKIAVQQPLTQAQITTHELASGNVILGISEYGGGYINKLAIPGIGNIISKHSARYGRGGQASIRDSLHKGYYNPTQAGFSDMAGTYCQIEQPTKGLLIVSPRPCSLWNGDGKYDFTEWENLAIDPYPNDNGNSDSDLIDESMLAGKQADEITSEFDFTASYKDVRDGKDILIPTFLFTYEFRFIREPGHPIKQFRRGTPAYDAKFEIADRSNLMPRGIHPSSEDSLTGVIFSSMLRGDKDIWNPDVVYLVNNNGELYTTKPTKSFREPFFNKSKVSKYPLIILSKSIDPDKGPSIGYYHPNSHINLFTIVGRSLKDHSISYEDDRRTEGILMGSFARTPDMWLFGIRTYHMGLLNRRETPSGVYEAIRGESYILIGTPNEIFEAVRAINRIE